MSNTNAGLMNKTKKELVEIINNQDVTLANLKNDFSVCKDSNKRLQDTINTERAKLFYYQYQEHLKYYNDIITRRQSNSKFDRFILDEDELDFPVCFASAVNNTCSYSSDLSTQTDGLGEILDTIIEEIPSPISP